MVFLLSLQTEKSKKNIHVCTYQQMNMHIFRGSTSECQVNFNKTISLGKPEVVNYGREGTIYKRIVLLSVKRTVKLNFTTVC